MAFDTPAVVVGAGVNGLGVARSLKRARVPVFLLDTEARRPEMHTRAAKPLVVRGLQGETLIDELVHLGATRFAGSQPVLLLTQEESVKAVSQYRERLSMLYRFSLPPQETVEALQHKHGFQCLAERFGAPIPRLVHVHAPADVPSLAKLQYPVAVKPGARHAVYSRHFKKAYRVESAAEAVELVGRILAVMDDVVVQEWIEGPDSNIHFCLQSIDRDGRVVASFTGRKLRSWPPQVGGTASCQPAPEAHAALDALTTRFFHDAGVVGLASMEYKLDAATDEFRMVEPTIGRTDYQEEVAALNGVNLPFAAYCAELDLPFPAPVLPKRPTAWRVRSEDVQSAAAQQQRASEGFATGGKIADALWRVSDPMPWLVQTLGRIPHALHARIAKRLPASQPVRSQP